MCTLRLDLIDCLYSTRVMLVYPSLVLELDFFHLYQSKFCGFTYILWELHYSVYSFYFIFVILIVQSAKIYTLQSQ